MQDLSGKVILITGASSGIGRASAELLASKGAKVIVNYRSNEKSALEVVQCIQENGGEAIAIQADVTNKDQVNAMVDRALASFGTIDVLINNAAGGIRPSTFMEASEELWEEAYRLNIISVLLCSQAVLKHMVPRKKGKIINISSTAARIGGAGESIHYASTKGALNTMTIGMSRELIEYGIIVNGVAPGVVETPFHEKFAPDDDRLTRMSSTIPIKRIAKPIEIAESIAFLSSDASNYILGEIINVSGGR
ncbi:glucose 1-dehydrogenase [Heyndrickxia oleronia]|uniref:Short-chain dehydrogenase n=1 Tax=Heyndrickxia oleronia TaxID=38875 RepID=A0A8E2IB61_9BACI|nr:glucose 1-dehydrogenase [Heyndrickxia oleronia]NYV66643.1 glucose 1-dehydrogenase [Bacillus sp. Gen3]OJH17133.1 short-chain dehydrogenase [Bacillus obstructivus]MEC1376878.1 glucose 1-dehydrogenase [Heyndrickxia oleronia]OOP67730.1 short-chain dehydrogenase [Heyndrickxia oleronia]QQZ03719.1 glucose 1-dehydrogenase [Heyndrickxia oleronia]